MSSEEESSNEYESDEEIEEVEEESDDESEEEGPIEEEVKPMKTKRTKKQKDSTKPKRGMSAFFFYSNANRARVKEENPSIAFGDVAKILSADYKKLTEKEKKKWIKLAEKDKIRYKEEMKNYVPPDSDSDEGGKKKKKKKAKKDPNKPKRGQTAYFLYSNAIRSKVKDENPKATFGDIAKVSEYSIGTLCNILYLNSKTFHFF
mmetsp:Transcript_10539/g.14870  ORF Transcript_10539/g.14870 Transcript_10539/m.14870 type:complete len:204 (-) Transcript_10539:833-1444(-)